MPIGLNQHGCDPTCNGSCTVCTERTLKTSDFSQAAYGHFSGAMVDDFIKACEQGGCRCLSAEAIPLNRNWPPVHRVDPHHFGGSHQWCVPPQSARILLWASSGRNHEFVVGSTLGSHWRGYQSGSAERGARKRLKGAHPLPFVLPHACALGGTNECIMWCACVGRGWLLQRLGAGAVHDEHDSKLRFISQKV